jgi:small subunit ribosomal protein S18
LARDTRDNGPEEEQAPSSEESGGGRRRFVRPPRLCQFCAEKVKYIDYKQVDLLKRFVTEQGRIRSRRQTGNCARHQRILARAVKRARHIALLPFAASRMR